MRWRLVVLLTALAVVVPGSAQAGGKDVTIGDNFFNPDAVRVVAGGEVHWSRQGVGNPHSVHQDDGLFDSGDPTSGPIDFNIDLSAGTFHYHCEVHGSPSGGMDGVVRVPVIITSAPPGRRFTVRWATEDTQTGSTFDVQYKIGSGQWRNWKRDTSTLKGVFGKNGNPVPALNGVKYSFRARSQDGNASSRYSPKKSFTP